MQIKHSPHALILAILVFCPGMVSAEDPRFDGNVVVTWLESKDNNDRLMRLERPFTYIDSRGEVWSVPVGTKVDGASIPSVFWNTIGPPFVGDYRRASVVHDYFCQSKSRPWQLVHRMFYEASRVGGVSALKAKSMYAAVYAGGPRWPEPGRLDAAVLSKPEISSEEFANINNWIAGENPSLSDIEARLESK